MVLNDDAYYYYIMMKITIIRIHKFNKLVYIIDSCENYTSQSILFLEL